MVRGLQIPKTGYLKMRKWVLLAAAALSLTVAGCEAYYDPYGYDGYYAGGPYYTYYGSYGPYYYGHSYARGYGYGYSGAYRHPVAGHGYAPPGYGGAGQHGGR